MTLNAVNFADVGSRLRDAYFGIVNLLLGSTSTLPVNIWRELNKKEGVESL